jgi:thymidine phosphorylase
MDDPAKARMLAKTLVGIGHGAGLPITALLTDMDEVLGTTVGHALEMDEAVSYLTAGGPRDARLHEVTIALAAEMLCLGKLASSVEEGRAKAQASLDSGKAAEYFSRMVTARGGPSDYLEAYEGKYRLPAKVVKPFLAPRAGFIEAMDCRAVGVAAIGLGGGRRKATDAIDLTVGFSRFMPVGTRLHEGDIICLVHAADETKADAAIAALGEAVRIGGEQPAPSRPVSARITDHL